MSGSAVENTGRNITREELTLWLRQRVAEHVRLPADEIGVDVPFWKFGLDSVYAFIVVAQVEEYLGISLDPALMWDRPTVNGLVEAIAPDAAGA